MSDMTMTAWPSVAVRAGVCVVFLLVIALLSALLMQRVSKMGSLSGLRRAGYTRLLVVAVLFDSWLFAFASAVVLFGVDSGLNYIACTVGIWWCIFLYATSKILIYVFLLERLYMVHMNQQAFSFSWRDRFASWWYRIGFLLLLSWFGVGVTMCLGKNSTRSDDGSCMIGLKVWATVPMLAVDALVNVFLTAGFVWPLYKAKFQQAKGLARSSCIASSVALITSFANILILSLQHGHQAAFVCLSSCVADVCVNSIILYAVTNRIGEADTTAVTSMGPTTRTTCANTTEYAICLPTSDGHSRNTSYDEKDLEAQRKSIQFDSSFSFGENAVHTIGDDEQRPRSQTRRASFAPLPPSIKRRSTAGASVRPVSMSSLDFSILRQLEQQQSRVSTTEAEDAESSSPAEIVLAGEQPLAPSGSR